MSEMQIRTIELPMSLLQRIEKIRREHSVKDDAILVRALELGVRILEQEDAMKNYREGKTTQED
jgi:hypothetical protein